MKKLKQISLIILSILAITSACNKNKTPEQNQTPNLDRLLSDAQVTLAQSLGGFDVAITSSLWLQQTKGDKGKALSRYEYTYTTKDADNLWLTMYRTIHQLDSIINYAQEKKAYFYEAAADVLKAIALGNMTDLFGDIPYSEIYQTDSAHFDPQQQIYQVVFQLLNQAINLINNGDPGQIELGSGDKIYNWNMDLWKRAAYTLLARYHIHLSQVEDVDYSQVLADLDNGLTSNDQDMKVYFYQYDVDNPPIFTYLNKPGGIVNNINFLRMLANYQDPRTRVLAYDGFWAQQDSYFPLVQYTEALFIRSEAYWRLNMPDQAKDALKQAVKASLDKYLVNDTAWYNNYCNYVDTLNNDTLIYEIYTQEYFDMVYNPEAYNLWRRVDYPNLTPVTGDSIPVRFPYSQQELSRNPNSPQWGTDVDLYTPVWWDR